MNYWCTNKEELGGGFISQLVKLKPIVDMQDWAFPILFYAIY